MEPVVGIDQVGVTHLLPAYSLPQLTRKPFDSRSCSSNAACDGRIATIIPESSEPCIHATLLQMRPSVLVWCPFWCPEKLNFPAAFRPCGTTTSLRASG